MVREDLAMKGFLWSAVAAAALMIAAPAWAQQQQSNPATGQPGLGAPMTPAYPNSATPPAHHVYKHAKAMHAHHKYMARKAALTGDTTAQLNREELARIQSGNLSNPPAAPYPAPGGPPGGGAPYPGPGAGGNAPPPPPPHY
jgi:opacity protein-like surface antigen